MPYLPTICEGCARVSLTAFNGASATTPECIDCGGARRVVPSCSFGRDDVPLFEELCAVIGVELAPAEAERLNAETSRALWSGTFSDVFDVLATRWSAMVPLLLLAGDSEPAQRRILLALKTIFDALMSTRRSGVVVPLAAVPTRKLGDE
jgi:hypothetical protein